MQLVRNSPDIPDALHISQEALQDHVPELLDDLVDRLRLEKEGPQETVADHSRSHGRAQWKAGYNLSELIWEIYIIKRVLKQSDPRGICAGSSRILGAGVRGSGKDSSVIFSIASRAIRWASSPRNNIGVVREKSEALEQTNQARDRLTRTVSHELRNVLNALTLATSMLGEDATPDERHEMSAICARMLADMSTILNDLLDFLRAGGGAGAASARTVFAAAAV